MSLINVSIHAALATAMIAVSVAVAAEAHMYRGYEVPAYEVTHAEGDFELRSYGPQLLAEVSVSGTRNGAINRGFRTLADYIFGGNVERQKVEMTVPVAQARNADRDDTWTVQFMMPASFSTETLPTPRSDTIRFVESERNRQAVIRFSGRWTDQKLARKQGELRDWAADRGLRVTSGPHYYFYDGPFTMPFNRRNEIAFVVR